MKYSAVGNKDELTQKSSNRDFCSALKGQVLKADEIAEEKSDEEEKRRSEKRKIRRKGRERNDEVETGR